MGCLLLVAVLLALTQAETPNTTVLENISWQESVEEVNRTNSLAQVLKEYLDDIETVEAATSHCATGHRNAFTEAERSLRTVMELCVDSSDHQREALAGCVEDKVGRRVSDVRQQITRLKNCVDTS